MKRNNQHLQSVKYDDLYVFMSLDFYPYMGYVSEMTSKKFHTNRLLTLEKNTTKWNMSDDVCAPLACNIAANDILKTA